MLRGYPSITGLSTLNARLRCPSTLSGTGARPIPSVAAPPCFDTCPGQRRMPCHVGRQAAEVARWWSLHEGLHVVTQALADLAWKQHVATHVPTQLVGLAAACERRWKILAGAGLAVAPPVRLARVSSGGPTRVLPGSANFPVKDLAGGLVGFFGEDGCLHILI